MEIVKVNQNQIVVANEVLEKLQKYQEYKKEMDALEKDVKNAITVAMRENGIKSFDNDIVKITYTAPTTKKIVDTDALKEQGLFELYCKDSQVKESVRITWKTK